MRVGKWFSEYGSWGLLGPALLLGLGRGFIVPVLPILARDEFGIQAAGAAIIFIAISIGTVASTLPTGYLVDKIGRRKVLIASPLTVALSSVLIITATRYELLLAYLVINGFGLQMWMLTRLVTVADTGKPHQRGRMITGMSGVQRTGLLIGPFIGGLAGSFFDLRLPFVLYAVVCLAAALVMYRYIPESSPTHVGEKSLRPGRGTPRPSLRELLVPGAVRLFCAQFLSNIAHRGMAGQAGPALILAAYAYNLSAAALGTISLIVGVVTVPVTFLNGFIMDRFGRKRAYVPGAIVLAACLAGFAGSAAFGWPLWVFVALFAVGNVALAFMAGTLQTMNSDIAPEMHRGRFIGLSRLIAASGGLTTPIMYSAALALLVAPGGYVVGFGLMAAAALGASHLIQRTITRSP